MIGLISTIILCFYGVRGLFIHETIPFQSSPGTVGVNKTPSSVLNNNHNYSELIPYVCSSCGYVDFYVEEPGKFV